jgi:DNA-binding GntR family transcriptional regulator
VPRLNEAWHRTIYAACGSTHLHEFIRRLWDIFPWRGMWDNYDMDCSELAESDHSEIMDAIRNRKAKRAARLMHNHMEAGQALVLRYIEREKAEHQLAEANGNGSVVSTPH